MSNFWQFSLRSSLKFNTVVLKNLAQQATYEQTQALFDQYCGVMDILHTANDTANACTEIR